jgi:hypothetical protein
MKAQDTGNKAQVEALYLEPWTLYLNKNYGKSTTNATAALKCKSCG